MKPAKSAPSSRRRVLLSGVCCVAAVGWRVARGRSASADTQDVIRRYDVGRFSHSYRYGYEILDAALQLSKARFGPYTVEPVVTEMSEERLRREVLKGDLVNVVVHNADYRELNDGLIVVAVPLDRGLQGFRVGLIRAGNEGRVSQVQNLEQLRELTIGAGEQWSDVQVYRANGIDATTARSYGSLLLMLQDGRFDVFPRSATGILAEYAKNRALYPNLIIDPHLLIYWPSAICVYVSRSAPRLAERVRFGLQKMQEDGSFEKHFEQYYSEVIVALDFPKRTLIALENPFFLPGQAAPGLNCAEAQRREEEGGMTEHENSQPYSGQRRSLSP